MKLMYRFFIAVMILVIGLIPALAVEKSDATATEGFKMTGMKRDTVVKETASMTFKGMRRETATRVLKETSKKNK